MFYQKYYDYDNNSFMDNLPYIHCFACRASQTITSRINLPCFPECKPRIHFHLVAYFLEMVYSSCHWHNLLLELRTRFLSN